LKSVPEVDVAVQAEAEVEAQLKIIRALKPLAEQKRLRVLEAVGHLLIADMQVPGVFQVFLDGMDAKRKGNK
jgi:hypothetical protein